MRSPAQLFQQLVLLSLLILVAAPRVAASDPATHRLRGLVHDTANKPVAGAWVEVRRVEHGAADAADFEAPPFASMRSDESGRWAFAELPEGTWVLSVVAGAAPHTDDELEKMARPSDDGHPPVGSAVTRIIRCFTAEPDQSVPWIDIGVATNELAGAPLAGKLVGAFDPTHFGYEVRLTHATVMANGVVMTSTVVHSGSEPGPADPVFTAVPDLSGRFDFGSLEAHEQDSVSVTAFPLAGQGGAKDGGTRDGGATSASTVTSSVGVPPPNALRVPGDRTAYSSMVGVFSHWEKGIEIRLAGQQSITLKAVTAAGEFAPIAENGHITFTIWNEAGFDNSSYGDEATTTDVLEAGTYLARAAMDDYVSAIVAFEVKATGGPAEVPLPLQPCAPYRVHLVDAKGAPLGQVALKLGIEASKAWPKPCRVSIDCNNGDIDARDILPGTYYVEFRDLGKPPFTKRIEFKRDGVPVVVTPT